MKSYFSPGACSLACRISLYEAGLAAQFVRVDLKAKTTEHGEDFKAINSKGYVPMLMLGDGAAVTEIDAVLDYIAVLRPQLRPAGGLGRTRLIEMLSYLSSELHVAFKPFWPAGDAGRKAEAAEAVAMRLDFLEDRLSAGHLLGPTFTAADAYLFVMLRWAKGFNLPLSPALLGYAERIKGRDTVLRALGEEGLS